MKLTFLGTRGNIDARSPSHYQHTALLVSYRGRSVMIDCRADWRGRLDRVAPRAVVVTHAHPDHALGLKDGTRRPVHATAEAGREMDDWPITERRLIEPRRPVSIAGITFEAFPVEHSLRAPAVGYRVSAGRVVVFYVPDVVYIEEREAALSGARLFIGDGATLTRPLIRRRDDRLIGPHAGSHPADLVQGGGDPPRGHHPLRQRDRHGRRGQDRGESQGHGRGPRRRGDYRRGRYDARAALSELAAISGSCGRRAAVDRAGARGGHTGRAGRRRGREVHTP